MYLKIHCKVSKQYINFNAKLADDSFIFRKGLKPKKHNIVYELYDFKTATHR